jgi:DNA-directed RNA polymerase specialized sigma24 family protein
MGKPRLMTDDEKRRIIELYEDGLNTVEISSIIDRSQTAVESI